MNPSLSPTTPVQYLTGVGPYLAGLFEKKSVRTAMDLLFYLPLRYVDRREIFQIKHLPVGKSKTFIAKIESYHIRFLGKTRRKILEVIVRDNSGVAVAVFFNFHEASMKKRFPVGTEILFSGEIKNFRGVKQIAHPEMEIWDEDEVVGGIYPLYSLTEGLHQKTVRRIIRQNLPSLLSMVRDDPRSVRGEGEVLISLAQALQYVHEPPSEADVIQLCEKKSPYHQRIIYDEFFYLQLGLISKRYRSVQRRAVSLVRSDELFSQAVSLLPFELTLGQRQVLDEIRSDFNSGHPMNRLLQGDVGSGKTIVAFLSSLFVIKSRLQVALMAPTEILAEQHYKNLLPYEDKLGIRIELLTGSTPQRRRDDILTHLAGGRVDLLIGTHALITPEVRFYHLGYIIVDEQHRFGVMQRAELKSKAGFSGREEVPHMLFMTATPIPRTLSLCVYGDLDISLLKERPRGRQEIITKVFRENQRSKVHALMSRELEKGRQIYVVCPLIEESEKMDLKAATETEILIKKEFSAYAVGLLHGRQKTDEKDRIMSSFKTGKISILVSTTVIEVGVDVPNATVMVIEHAERFGLSQLHQLRGRVGRGAEQSYCVLMAAYAQSQESRYRLEVMTQTNDGFVIAEEDLKLRGPGEFVGTRQSGLPDFRLAELIRDQHLLVAARKRAEEILQEDPLLSDSKNSLLKQILMERWGRLLDFTLV